MYASPAVALAALVVSALALLTSRKTLKVGGPGIRVALSPGPLTTDWRDVGVRVTVTNQGRAAIDVLGFVLLPDKALRMYPQRTEPSGGEALPYRLEAFSSRTWNLNPWTLLDTYEVLSRYRHYPGDFRERTRRVSARRLKGFRVQVLLGNSRKVTVKDRDVLNLAALLEYKVRTKSVYDPDPPPEASGDH